MGVDIAVLQDTSLPPGYELVRIGSDAAESDEWTRQFSTGYGLPLGLAQHFSPAAFSDAIADGTAEFFAVRRKGAIVATSLCYLADGVAGIYCVATLPEERRKGLGFADFGGFSLFVRMP
jgi:hypothetical protein